MRHISQVMPVKGGEEKGRLIKTDIIHNPVKSSYKSKNNYSKFFLVHLNLTNICGVFVFKAELF